MDECTIAWVDLVNRGGLDQVSDELYLFIKSVEMEARTILNQELLINYCGEDLKTVLYIVLSQRVKTLQYAGITLLGIKATYQSIR